MSTIKRVILAVVLVSVGSVTACLPLGGPDTKSLEGKPVPAGTLQALSGESRTLADLKGKVVVLDFWATWCPPCRESLPILADVAQEYANNERVVVFAVNQGESREEVESFLAQGQLPLPVALDPDGALGDKFLVRGIPTTVIVGPDGTIKLVEVGFSRAYGETLRETITGLL